MGKNLIERYIWILDTVRSYGRISRRELDRRWADSSFGDGQRGLPRRTLFNYRQGIEELFGVQIQCDPATYEYYIEDAGGAERGVSVWMLDAAALSSALHGARDVASRIMLEDVPSAREFLRPVVEAMRANRRICFDYHPYTRSQPNRRVVIEPYFMRIFRQVWYVTGRNIADDKVKTYALDRMSGLSILEEGFNPPEGLLDPEEYFRDSFGITVNSAEAKRVVLRVNLRQAKYLRALPLHASQQEEVHDDYSLFTLRLRITDDFLQQILSMGSAVTVIAPAELRAMVVTQLSEALANYR